MMSQNTFLYVLTVLIWGSTWLAIEFQLGVVAPEASIVYRYAAAALLLFVWALVRRQQLRFGWRAHGWFLLLGLFLFCLNYVFAYRAQQFISSAMTAIAFSTLVWLNIFNARLFFGVRSSARVLWGAGLGIAGILVLYAPRVDAVSLNDGFLFGSSLALLGALLASFGNMASQAAQRARLPLVASNAWGMLYGAGFTAAIAGAQGVEFTVDWSLPYLLSLAYLTIFGSVIAFGAYLTLLGRIGAHRAGYATVMFPVVALLLSVLFEGLVLDWTLVSGVGLVLLGNLFVLQRKQRGAGGRASGPAAVKVGAR